MLYQILAGIRNGMLFLSPWVTIRDGRFLSVTSGLPAVLGIKGACPDPKYHPPLYPMKIEILVSEESTYFSDFRPQGCFI